MTEGPLYDLWSLLLFGKDGDEHKRLRNSVARELTPRAVEQYRPDIEQYASRLADQLCAASSADGQVDLWSSFSLPLAARSACRVVGIPQEDADRAGQWSIDLVGAFFIMNERMRERAERAAVEFVEYLDGHMAEARSTPGDDVTSRLLDPPSDQAHDLTDPETRALIANLVFGGLEATAKAITTGTFHLLNEGQWATLVAHPEHAPHAVMELLRFAPPVGTARLATEDAVVCDVELTAGQLAVLNIDGACRDPRRYEHPDSLDLTRAPGRQMAFGAGPHYCLGANLARVVMETALTTLTARCPELHVAAAGPEDVRWDYETFSGIVQLPVAV